MVRKPFWALLLGILSNLEARILWESQRMVERTVIGRNSAGEVGWFSFGIKLVTPLVKIVGIVDCSKKRL